MLLSNEHVLSKCVMEEVGYIEIHSYVKKKMAISFAILLMRRINSLILNLLRVKKKIAVENRLELLKTREQDVSHVQKQVRMIL